MIGRSRECHLCLSNQRISSRHAKITFESGKYKIVDLDSKNHTFVNGRRITSHCLQEGDVISIAHYSIVFENGTLVFQNTGEDLKVNLEEKKLVRRYPLFRRSPRLGYVQEYNGIEIQPPPQTGEKPQINWLVVFLPPLVMTGVSVASMVMTEGDLMNLVFVLPMSFVTVLTTIISYFSQVRKHKRDLKKKIRAYDQYIEKVITETKDCYQQQLSSVNQANPDTVYCYDIVSNRMRRLWERSFDDNDFLEIRLGKGVRPLDIEVHLPRISVGEEVPSQLIRLQDELSKLSRVRDIAVTLPLKKACLTGVVGNRQVAVKVIQNAVVQLATHHSYVDMNLIIIGDEKESQQWSWTRWLPHCLSSDRQLRYVSSDLGQASELLGIFEDVLRKRIEMIKNGRSGRGFVLPWLVFVITDCTLLEGRELLHLLAAGGMEAGASAILLFDSLNKLPKECSWFIEVNNSGGCVYAKENSTNRTSFVLDAFADYDRFARAMAPIRDRNAVKSSQLPSSVTFYQGYGIQSAEEIDLLKNWMTANPQKSLAAPLGTKENGKPFLFDIHEKAHGPHGLVAGTTGSGKSEVLQTWILSMCLNYSPQDVSFVLIDFKGMGLAGTLKGLPHIAGTISDVDENIQRNLFSLESELSRRKMLFADASSETMKIGDIYDYQDAYKKGKLTRPLSHLIIVVDEFAELKSKFPDFMAALDSAARVGRSLGVHLVLATQKPDGVVTDEVRANSKFKWCLKVANEGESKAVLSRPEAASIPISTPGRAYIQIGNNEIFELVQTYYSGANVVTKSVWDEPVRISFVDTVGRRTPVGRNISSDTTESEKELLAIVRRIKDVHKASGLPGAEKIWEEGLPKRLVLSDVPDTGKTSSLSAVIGIVDDPRHQKQYPCEIDLASDGHMIIYGAPATGKTVLLQTMIMSLAVRYTPDEVNIYIMDFGSWSLKNLQALPHIGGVANGNETEKLLNLSKMLSANLDKRKTRFAQIGASSLEAYRQVTGESYPAFVVIVDNFAPVKELYPEIEDMFVRLSREGSSYGIFLVITASSLSGSISYHLSQNFKQALSLRMIEMADYRDIMGDTEGLEPAKVAGRGLIQGKPPMEFQTALAVNASDDVEYVSLIRQRCAELASDWCGNLPQEIPVMPEIVLCQHIKHISEDRIAIGLSEDEIAPVAFSVENRLLLISGVEESGKTNLLKVISRQLSSKGKVIFLNAQDEGGEQMMDVLRRAADGEKLTLIVDNLTQWLDHAGYDETDLLEDLIRGIKNNGFSFYAAGDASELVSSGGSVVNRMLQQGCSILLGGSFHEHSSQFEVNNISYTQQSEQLPHGYGYFIQKKKAVKFKALFHGGGSYGV
ncbi:MAG: type VII secretion protein EssC [Lachnospiraceae bacterium]|nr:type VII secretion protein EssC [Lachnospiraceae bacterium]